MYNPDFWEVRLEPHDLAKYANEAGIWFVEVEEEPVRRTRDRQQYTLMNPIMDLIAQALTQKQREALLLYYLHDKTQEEIAEIMGISRRVVSQHLFGICRNGKQVGGAIRKIRKLCRERGIAPQTSH